MTLSLYNTLTRKKDPLTPSTDGKVRMYVCGPTVYDRPHLGNARSVVVYDVLYRVLMQLYGKENVIFARNITDVDDKINAAAKANNEPISALTKRVEGWFHDDMAALNCLLPTHEPRATAHIPQMIDIIEKLIANGHAYVSQGHVLFAVSSHAHYGALSGRKLDELVAGARVEVESYKKHAGDFVLWKPADAGDDASSVFDSPWGKGRPGWHIECSAMSRTYLGEDFDIHGGGADLMFPHHENEIAQSCCAHPGSHYAKFWVHNGFLTVNGEKMSKSLGNFITVKDLLDQGVQGEVIRLAFLTAHYRSPLDWTEKLLHDSKMTLLRWNRLLEILSDSEIVDLQKRDLSNCKEEDVSQNFIEALSNDMNFSVARTLLDKALPQDLYIMGRLLGFFRLPPSQMIEKLVWDEEDKKIRNTVEESYIKIQIDARIAAKKAKDWAKADEIRKSLAEEGILLEDRPDGTTDWRRS